MREVIPLRLTLDNPNPNVSLFGGVDEAGRGCLAGPVYAACVVWDPDSPADSSLIQDSKRLSASKRLELEAFIQEHASAYAVSSASAAEIDSLNIRKATHLAMHRAISKVRSQVPIDHVLIDGNDFTPFPDPAITSQTVVKGDSTYVCIAAAGILAKVARDREIERLVSEDPTLDDHYGWSSNMAYGTEKHRLGIFQHGITEHHRRSFRLGPLE